MPFTISHIAAVLPFARTLSRWRVLSAAVVGSMAPDFGFLMPWRPARVETHSALALLTFSLPAGLAAFWIFQWTIRREILEILPDGPYERWSQFAEPLDITSLKQWALAAIGILGGAFTHLVWDAFTHEEARGIRMFPALDDPMIDIAGHHLVGARLLQDVSSVIGMGAVLAITIYGLRPGRRSGASPARVFAPAERYTWIGIYGVVAVLLTAVFLFLRPALEAPGRSLGGLVGNSAIAGLRGCTAAVLVVSLALGLRLRANPVRSARNQSR